ncbi:unnamed protein product [Adineta ricciae]|uniref:Apple domain-containing protein n=1 Tax=Adineta ricciae TaxID=249248 RepID=A0A815TVC4_ADIRI|nr:unnamed protein product [Adineta ricciae]
MKIIILLCYFLTTTSFQGEHFALSGQGNRFQPIDNIQLLSNFSNVDVTASCAMYCLQNTFCRTFDFDSISHQCHLYEGSVDTGMIIPANSSNIIGWIEILPSMFHLYNASADQCKDNRYLSSDIVSNRCQCPDRTFWNGSMCLNQRFIGDTCQENNWCRNDLNIGCILSICSISPTTTISSTTTTATCTTLINYNDIENQTNTSGDIPNGYKNLLWTNAEYINVSSTPIDSGYRSAVSNGVFVMQNKNNNNITISTANV